MNKTDTYTTKRGGTLVIVNGYRGEKDFYRMHDIINKLLAPETSGFSVDAMCVGGYFRKNNLLIRTSSESPYDYISFYYDPAAMTEEELVMIRAWIDTVVDEMHTVHAPVFVTDDF